MLYVFRMSMPECAMHLTADYSYQGYAWIGKGVCERSGTVPRKQGPCTGLFKINCLHYSVKLFVSQHFIVTVLLSYLLRLVQSSPEQIKLIPG